MEFKVKVFATSLVGSFTFFAKCNSADIHVFFEDTNLTLSELAQFVSPRTFCRYKSYFDKGPVHCVVLKAVAI